MAYPLFFLKVASDVVSFPLSIFFNLFIEQGCFPESLKLSKVIPIFKSGAKCDLSNYRPITVSILVVWKANGFYVEAVSLLLKLRHLVKVVVVTILCIANNISFAKFQIGYAL